MASPQTRLAMARRSGVRAQPPHLGRADLERARRVHHAQLRTASASLVLLTAVVVGLPLVLAALPELSDLHLFGIRVSWLAVAVLPYAALVALAVGQLRRAERLDAAAARHDGPRHDGPRRDGPEPP